MRKVYSEQAQSNNMGTPCGRFFTGAVTGGDASSVKCNSDIKCSFTLADTVRLVDCGT